MNSSTTNKEQEFIKAYIQNALKHYNFKELESEYRIVHELISELKKTQSPEQLNDTIKLLIIIKIKKNLFIDN